MVFIWISQQRYDTTMQNPYRRPPQRSTAVTIRQCRMIGYYNGCHTPNTKYVVAFRRTSSVWIVLRIMIMYASVDTILLLPILILINVVSIWHVLCVFT